MLCKVVGPREIAIEQAHLPEMRGIVSKDSRRLAIRKGIQATGRGEREVKCPECGSGCLDKSYYLSEDGKTEFKLYICHACSWNDKKISHQEGL